MRQPMLLIVLASMALSVLLAASPAAAADGCYDPARVPWQRLDFKASKLGLTARASMEFETMGRHRAEKRLTRLGAAPLAPRGPSVLMTTGTSFLGRSTQAFVLLDAADGRAYERFQEDGGKRHRIKIYRFGSSEVASRRVVPANDREAELPSERWTGVSEADYPIAPSVGLVSEPSVLLYLVSSCSAAALAKGREMVLFSDKQLSRVTVQLVEETPLRVDYTIGEARISGEVATLRLAVRALPIEAGEDSRFELMGLDGDIDVYIDQKTRVPVKISGRISPAGRVNIKLESMTAAPGN